MESFGIELYEISFEYMCNILADFDINFNWQEKDRQIPNISWKKFLKLSFDSQKEIGKRLLNPVHEDLVKGIKFTIERSEDWEKWINELELLLKPDINEYFTYSFNSIKDTLQFLLNLQVHAPDISKKL